VIPGGKFATGIEDTGSIRIFPPVPLVLLIPVANNDVRLLTFFPRFLIADYFHFCACLAANISENLRKTLNCPHWIFWGLVETDACKKSEVENLVALSL
jgi:hypothetical protein